MKVTIEIDDLTDAQSIALEDMMRMWMSMGGRGCSRFTSFYADGDGNFRPKILFNGEKPKWFFNPKTGKTSKPIDPEYKIDFDEIAWLLHDYKPQELQKAQEE